jgi:hypothetical protein
MRNIKKYLRAYNKKSKPKIKNTKTGRKKLVEISPFKKEKPKNNKNISKI